MINVIVFIFILTLYPNICFCADPKDEYKKIQRDLNVQKKRLENVQKKEISVINDLRKVQSELVEIDKQLITQRKKIKGIQAKISTVEKEIKTFSHTLTVQQERFKKRLRSVQRQDYQRDMILIFLSGANIQQTARYTRYLRDISELDYKLILSYKDSLKTLSIEQTQLKKLHESLRAEEKKLAQLEQELNEKKKEREQLLLNVRKEKKSYEKMIAELQESSARLKKLIEETERREREARQKRRQQAKPGENEEHDDTNFSKLKGKLSWPAQGTVVINYGSQVDPIFNLPVFRSGIHIKTPPNMSVKSIHEGRVVYASEFKGYGRLVIVSHGGGYHSLYGNLSKISVKNGVEVKDQQVIGEAGDSSTIGSTGIYFEIRYKGKPLDPQQWLKR